MVSATCYMTALSHGRRGAIQIATGSSKPPTIEEKKPASSNPKLKRKVITDWKENTFPTKKAISQAVNEGSSRVDV